MASFAADLSGLEGGSAVVFASGFLTPSANQNGEAFGLYAALGNGTVVAFPSVSQARLQVIHNAADKAAASVDVYLWNGDENELVVKLDDFAFRTATPFVDVPAGDSLAVIIAGQVRRMRPIRWWRRFRSVLCRRKHLCGGCQRSGDTR